LGWKESVLELIEFLRKEWASLAAAPFSFLGLLALAFGTCFLMLRWRYEGILDSLRERIEAREDRLKAKDEQLDEYRQKLELVQQPEAQSGNAYTRLGNEELKRRSLLLVRQLRDFISRTEAEDRKQSEQHWRQSVEAKTEEQRTALFHAETQGYSERSLARQQEYDQSFKVEAILLRDELRARIPDLDKERHRRVDSSFEHPVNFFCLREVADELEKLARVLA
jgi:hypothetical protein